MTNSLIPLSFKAFDVNDGIEAYKTGINIKNNKEDRLAAGQKAATDKQDALSRKQLETSAQLSQKWAMTPNLDKSIIKQDIDEAFKVGAFDEPTYQQQISHIDQLPNDPQQLADWSKSMVAKTMKAHEVMGILQPSADKRLASDTSMANAQLGANTTMRGQDLTNSLGRDRLNVDSFNSAATRDENARYHDMQGKNFQDNLKLQQQKANEPKPLSEYQQFQIGEKKDKRAADYQDAMANLDTTLDEFKGLKDIQDRTTTGPYAGSAPAVMARNLLPNSWGGGEDLQRLEQGYNTMAVKAIAAFKAGGVSFGQLSNAEGNWIKSTTATLQKGEPVNQEILDHGIKLLEDRKKRIKNQFNSKTEEPTNTGGATGSWETSIHKNIPDSTPDILQEYKAMKGYR